MIDRALNFGPVQQQSYYFQLIPLSLSIINPESQVPAAGTTYRFSILKGQQKFDENKVPIEAKFYQSTTPPVMVISNFRLNFYLPSFNKIRKQEFQLRLTQNQHNQDYEIGDYAIDANALIAAYKENHTTRHQLTSTFSEDYELAFEIYVQRTRVAVEKVVKEYSLERVSPLKARQEVSPTPKKEAPAETLQIQPGNNQQTPSRDTQEPQPESAPTRSSRKQSLPQEEPPCPPKEEKPVKEQSEKNEVASQHSASKLPVIQTRLKAVTKADAPAEVRVAESQRLSGSTTAPESQAKASGEPDLKQKLMLWGFLLLSGIVMYYAMQPNRRV